MQGTIVATSIIKAIDYMVPELPYKLGSVQACRRRKQRGQLPPPPQRKFGGGGQNEFCPPMCPPDR